MLTNEEIEKSEGNKRKLGEIPNRYGGKSKGRSKFSSSWRFYGMCCTSCNYLWRWRNFSTSSPLLWIGGNMLNFGDTELKKEYLIVTNGGIKKVKRGKQISFYCGVELVVINALIEEKNKAGELVWKPTYLDPEHMVFEK